MVGVLYLVQIANMLPIVGLFLIRNKRVTNCGTAGAVAKGNANA